jgi:hypothetical protein
MRMAMADPKQDEVPLPAPWTVASTIKCTACGRPYEPARYAAFAAFVRPTFGGTPKYTCECGNASFAGTLGEGPSPAQFTADQMRAYGQACALAASMRAAHVCRERAGTMSMFATSADAKHHNAVVDGCALSIEADAGIKGA